VAAAQDLIAVSDLVGLLKSEQTYSTVSNCAERRIGGRIVARTKETWLSYVSVAFDDKGINKTYNDGETQWQEHVGLRSRGVGADQTSP
jgi:hypothetical protein